MKSYLAAITAGTVSMSLLASAAVAAVPDRASIESQVQNNINSAFEVSVPDADTAQAPVVGNPDTFTPPVVDRLPQGVPSTAGARAAARAAVDAALSGQLDTRDIGPHVKCVILAPIGSPVPTFSSECPGGTTPPGTTTPPGGGTTTTPGGGGDGAGGGGDSSGGGSSGGGSNNGSSGGSSGGGGGNNNGGEVLGAETGGGVGVPDTGLGGDWAMTLTILLASFATMIASGRLWYKLGA